MIEKNEGLNRFFKDIDSLNAQSAPSKADPMVERLKQQTELEADQSKVEILSGLLLQIHQLADDHGRYKFVEQEEIPHDEGLYQFCYDPVDNTGIREFKYLVLERPSGHAPPVENEAMQSLIILITGTGPLLQFWRNAPHMRHPQGSGLLPFTWNTVGNLDAWIEAAQVFLDNLRIATFKAPPTPQALEVHYPCGITARIGRGADSSSSIAGPEREADAPQYNAAMDGLTSLILALGSAGVNIGSKEFIEGVETAAQAIAQQYD